jgi:nitrogen regulatory protein PII
MYEVKAFIRPQRVTAVIEALHALAEMPGITVSSNRGFGRSSTPPGTRFGETDVAKLETVVPERLLDEVIDAIRLEAATGRPGDGKIFVTRVERAIQIRSGETGPAIL